MKIEFAKETDIENLEALFSSAYVKMNFKKYGLDYNKDDVLYKLSQLIVDGRSIVLKCVNENMKLLGSCIAYSFPTLYCVDQTAISVIALQADGQLTNYKQSKIVLHLIKYLEKIAEQLKCSRLTINLAVNEFDFSKYLKRNNYQKTDEIYTRRFI
jgi:hypothetical protein